VVGPDDLDVRGYGSDGFGIYRHQAAGHDHPAAQAQCASNEPPPLGIGPVGNGAGIDDVPVGAGLGKGLLGVTGREEPLADPLAVIMVDLCSPACRWRTSYHG
jgi:hypothetical protein